jgi:hypothetical protein
MDAVIKEGLKRLNEKDREIYDRIGQLRDLMYERKTLIEMMKQKNPHHWIEDVLNSGSPLDLGTVEIYI